VKESLDSNSDGAEPEGIRNEMIWNEISGMEFRQKQKKKQQ
jgi:hypothetical protein